MDFKDLLTLVRRRWISIAAATLLAILASAAFTFSATPQYASHARVFISNDTSGAGDAYLSSLFSSARVQSYADLADSYEMMQRVILSLDLKESPAQLAQQVSATVADSTVIIDIEAKDASATQAQKIAQADAEELSSYLEEIETPKGKSSTPVKATVVDPANLNLDPVSPRVPLNLGLAAVIGLLVGVGIAILRELLDTSVKTPDEIEELTSSALMATIPFDNETSRVPLITGQNPHAPRAEQFRVLRTNLQFIDIGAEIGSFVITSAVPGEGKTMTSANLAIALAQAGRRVLLIDGDLRRGRAAEVFGLERSVGFTTTLIGRTDLADAIQIHSESGVHVLASGPTPPNPSEVLQSPATQELLSRLRAAYDIVLIDAPPLLPVADAAILSRDTDGAIMVVAYGRTSREELRQARNRLDGVGARLLGVVVNKAPRRGGRAYGYAAEYTYEYAPTGKGMAATKTTKLGWPKPPGRSKVPVREKVR